MQAILLAGGCWVRCCDVCGWPDLAGLTIWKMGELIMELVKIFIAGGVFCMFGEILWAKTGLGVVKTLMVCIAAGVVAVAGSSRHKQSDQSHKQRYRQNGNRVNASGKGDISFAQ